ncbi:unnamed protein product [Linum tenue]|uniref:non-specific serine/threonine protein kinase n=1 Tax=Linum tenue TaxID=586396 RepID=A0AAV0QH30_9ROSI|nr:unnamed protein product [Linum tenue]
MLKPALSCLSLYLLTVFAFFSSHGASQLQETPANDGEILRRIKQHWQNPQQLSHWSFPDSSSPCSWPEVNCSGTNSIMWLNFSSMNIPGTVPPFICDLKNLTVLDLYNNSIVGGFPRELYNCSKLEYLNLSQNYFVGPIPGDVDRLSSLNHLDLSGNNFTSDIPAAIGRLKELRVLYLNQNQFNATFPPEIGSLSNLEELVLAHNGFLPSRLHSSFTQLKNLKRLWVSNANLIGEIATTIAEMAALEYLDLSKNKLNGSIPDGLFKLKNLSVVYLYKNRLSGSIPQPVESLELTEVDLSQNNLSGTIPDDFGKLEKAKILNLFLNNFGGDIPESIGRLPQLKEFSVYTNNLSGSIPADFGRYSMLEVLQVNSNGLTGQLPEHLCSNGKLDGVAAHNNFLSGELPASLGNCSTLRFLSITNNSFSGELPAGLWTATNLETLVVGDNSFTGQLPDDVAWNLSRLEMSNNRFTGGIPTGVSNWSNMVFFSASNNSISGTIPPQLTSLPRLTTLLLDGNQLTGPLPSEISSWQSLTTLNLRRNQLSGQIPAQITNLIRLSELDLSENQLSGNIPPQISQLPITSLNLSSNLLEGNIPRQFENGAYSDSFLNNPGLCSSNSDLNLRSCNSRPSQSSKRTTTHILALALSIPAVVVVVSVISSFLAIKKVRGKHVQDSAWEFTSFQKLNFTEDKILAGLTESNVIGVGGSGKVYRVALDRQHDFVAVKRIWNDEDNKLAKDFMAEVETLSGIRHTNIVKLLCCISKGDSKLLVYEYMKNHSLDWWLRSGAIKRAALDWPKRLNIAIGAAQGLAYMHHDCVPSIIHRDVKSSNILLDSEFNPKIADFGLAKITMMIMNSSSSSSGEAAATLSTVAGSFGYMAPEYGQTRRVNAAMDVYSFGVVLLELTTGRQANGEGGEEKTTMQTSLAEWAWGRVREGKAIGDLLDEEVEEECHLDEMVSVFKLGVLCTTALPSSRPSMKEVVQMVERWRSEGSSGGKSGSERMVDESPLLENSNGDGSLPV